ncbi:hypothetical protein NKH28_32715 [Mesorhizobium sp. M1227]|uniref:hypothetical protein n=1 Tax=Mesorhizobium sp. M1227 TaxID=2957071 RepID=UPI003335D16D
MSFLTILLPFLETAMGSDLRADEASVVAAFENYASAWKKQDIERVWSLMSPNLKKGNGGSVKIFEDFVKRNGFYPSDFQKIDVSVNDHKATIKAKVIYLDFSGKRIGDDFENIVFVRIDGEWYFDSYTSLDK